MKKLVSLLTALALSASMAVIPVFAEGEFTPLTVTELPMGTTASFLPSTLDAETAKKADVNAISSDDRTLNSASVYGANDYIAIYPTSATAATIDGGDTTFDTRKYVARLKLPTGAEFDESNAPVAGMFSVTPAEEGVLIVDFSHPSGNPTDERTVYAYQDGAEFSTTAAANADNSKVSLVIENVAAHKPVYIYCKESGKGLNYHGVTLADSAPEEREEEVIPTPDKIGKNINVTFDTEKTIEATEKYNDTTVVYVGTGDSVTVDENNKTIDGRTYSTRMKLGSAQLNSSGVPKSRAFSIIPAADGILKVDFAATNKIDSKSLTAIQEGSEPVTENVPADGTATLSMAVKADIPVYIYGKSGANVYGYILIDASAEIVPSPMPINTTVKFDAGYDTETKTGTTFTEMTVFDNYILVIPGNDIKTMIDGSNKTIPEGGTKYTTRLKLGGTGSKTSRAVEIIPAAAGTLKIAFMHASSTEGTENAVLKAYQDGAVIGSQEVAQSAANGAVLEVEVVANKPVYIYSETQGANIYAITLADGNGTPDTPIVTGTCVKITATYINGAFAAIDIMENFPANDIPDTVDNSGNTKTFYWNSLSEMKPVTKADFPIAGGNTGGDDESGIEWGWIASNDTKGLAKGTALITGLTTLFADTANNSKYISCDENGDYVGTDGSATLKFEPASDGILKVKIIDLGSADKQITAAIVPMGASVENAVASYTTTGEKETVVLTGEVEAGKTYYVAAKGTKTRFAAALFTAQAVTKKWAVSDSAIGMTANTELIPGLTTLFDNSATGNKYITGAENGKLTEGVGSGTALKYEASSDGKLFVTMIDVGEGNKPVIYDYTERKDVFSYTVAAEKETVELKADVISGHTYYVTATGTKGRFSAASFTPAAASTTD